MKHSHGSHGSPAGHSHQMSSSAQKASLQQHNLTAGLIKGAAMSAGAKTGKSIMSKITKHPIILVGIGIVTGFCIHK